MTTLGFGQNVGQVVQIAYVVKDIHAAMPNWIQDCRVGPRFWQAAAAWDGAEPIRPFG